MFYRRLKNAQDVRLVLIAVGLVKLAIVAIAKWNDGIDG